MGNADRTTVRDRRSLDSLARVFLEFAVNECTREPVYDAICRATSGSERTLTLLWEAPLVQQKPNLLLAAIHDLVLAGVEDPLVAYFPSVGGDRAIDGDFAATYYAFCARFTPELRARIATRSTQTNEVGRSAVLEPCLAQLAVERGASSIALLDVGASAGLNLLVDRFRYDYGELQRGAPAGADVLTIDCRLRGEGRPDGPPMPPIVIREGIDLAPVDLGDEEAVRWLRACVWPTDRLRAERFERAVTLARVNPPSVKRSSDALAAIVRWIDATPPDAMRVVFHSWVLYYFTPDDRERFTCVMEELVRKDDVIWLSAESAALVIGGRPSPARGDYPGSTAYVACVRDGARVRYTTLADAHPHGTWMAWRGGSPSRP